jgi:hypothetical protein
VIRDAQVGKLVNGALAGSVSCADRCSGQYGLWASTTTLETVKQVHASPIIWCEISGAMDVSSLLVGNIICLNNSRVLIATLRYRYSVCSCVLWQTCWLRLPHKFWRSTNICFYMADPSSTASVFIGCQLNLLKFNCSFALVGRAHLFFCFL